MLSIVNQTKKAAIAPKTRVAGSWTRRLIGLLGTTALPEGEGLWLSPCTSVHSFFMRYPIDILFLNAQHEVIHQQTLVPWRLSKVKAKSVGVLELPAGTLLKTGTTAGDVLSLEPI